MVLKHLASTSKNNGMKEYNQSNLDKALSEIK